MAERQSPANRQPVGTVARLLAWLIRETRGQDVVEYALLLVMLALAAVGSIPELACAIQCAFEDTADSLQNDPGKGRKPNPPGQEKKCCKKK